MNNDRFQKIAEILNLGKLTSIPTKVSGGLLHLMWHLKTSHGDYAIKELDRRIVTTDQIIQSYEITEKIAASFLEKGVPAITSLKSNNKSLIEVDRALFIVYPWVMGTCLDRDGISPLHAKKIASVLAQMHLLNLHFPELSDPKSDTHTNEYFQELTDKSQAAKLPFAKALKENLNQIILWNKTYQKYSPILNSHLVVSHGDLDQKNILWVKDLSLWLIDWESARLLNPTQEILNAALDWSGVTSGKINLNIFETMLFEYKRTGGQINKDQANAAFWAIIGNWLNWMRYNIERSLDEQLATEEERQLGIKQVETVLKTLGYLATKISSLNDLVNNSI